MASATEKKSFTQKKRNFLTLEQRIAALKLLESGQSCRSVAEKLWQMTVAFSVFICIKWCMHDHRYVLYMYCIFSSLSHTFPSSWNHPWLQRTPVSKGHFGGSHGVSLADRFHCNSQCTDYYRFVALKKVEMKMRFYKMCYLCRHVRVCWCH
jgi:hypothetical protein